MSISAVEAVTVAVKHKTLEALEQCTAYLHQGMSYPDPHPHPDPDSDSHQNLIICSVAHCQPSMKILCKSVPKFLCKDANRQTNRQTDKQTNKQRRLYNFFGRGKNAFV